MLVLRFMASQWTQDAATKCMQRKSQPVTGPNGTRDARDSTRDDTVYTGTMNDYTLDVTGAVSMSTSSSR